MTLLFAFLLRDLRLQRSYRLQLLAQVGATALTLVSFAFLARLVPGSQAALRPYGGDYFVFVLFGSGAATFFTTALLSFSDNLGREQATGTLEPLLATPNDWRLLFLCGAAWPFAFGAIQMALYFVVAVVLAGARLGLQGFGLLALSLGLSLVTFAALGLVAAAVLIQAKRGAVAVGLMAGGFGILGGVSYPISILPGWVQVIAHLLPITYGLDAVRLSALPAPDGGRLMLDLLALVAFSVVLVPVSMAVIGWSIDRARRDGSLAHY
jgi:ABC-2 type transport system permease protein